LQGSYSFKGTTVALDTTYMSSGQKKITCGKQSVKLGFTSQKQRTDL